MDKDDKVHIHNGVYSVINDEILPFANMGWPTEYYAKWNKLDRERQILCISTYM